MTQHCIDAFVFGYPLVYDVTSVLHMVHKGLGSLDAAPFNTWARARNLAMPEDKFVSVNNDTLYLLAQLDLSGGPLLLRVPDTAGRYYVLQFVDAWTNNFAYIGRRSTGTGAGEFLIVPPGWSGTPENSVTVIESPTMVASIVGRLTAGGVEDLPTVWALQDAFSLTPLEGNGALAGVPMPDAAIPDSLRFWEQLRLWAKAFPPSPTDQSFLDTFADLGVTADASPYLSPDPEWAGMLARGAAAGMAQVDEFSHNTGTPINGWILNPHMFDYNIDYLEIGTKSTPEWVMSDRRESYVTRAAAARVGLWGNHGYEATYGQVFTDAEGKPLTGEHVYTVTFAAPPPAHAFWSLTMYSTPDYYLVANPIERYSIGDRTPGLQYGEDGSLTIQISASAPSDPTAAANWLPAPTGGFRPMIRIYEPGEEVFDGRYVLPAITRVA
jgi:hypothetical protein